jgi:hypothetical protein
MSVKSLMIICAVFSTSLFIDSHADEEKSKKAYERINELLPDCISPPLVNFAIPTNFHSYGLTAEAEPQLSYGLLWTTEAVAKEYWKSAADRSSTIPQLSNGAFMAVFSLDVAQTGEKTFSDKEGDVTDKKIESALKKIGIEKTKIRRVMWGTYPVISITGVGKATRQPFAMAWVGMNSSTFVLRISYVFSEDSSKHERDMLVWKQFIDKTAPISKEKA